MAEHSFVLQFPPEEISNLAKRYLAQDSGQDDAAMEAGKRIASGDISRENLRVIFTWKTGGRGISRLDRNSEKEIADALRLANEAKFERSAIAVLCGLNGIEVPVASAVLTAMKPEMFTIIDFRALESLGETQRRTWYSIDFYLRYLQACREIAKQHNVSLRTLDRALWQWSKEKGTSD